MFLPTPPPSHHPPDLPLSHAPACPRDADVRAARSWYQLGAYYPFFRGHAHLETQRREPWLFGPDATARIRDAIRTRYAILPFMYTLFRHANTSGLPVLRPLFFEFPDAEGARRLRGCWVGWGAGGGGAHCNPPAGWACAALRGPQGWSLEGGAGCMSHDMGRGDLFMSCAAWEQHGGREGGRHAKGVLFLAHPGPPPSCTQPPPTPQTRLPWTTSSLWARPCWSSPWWRPAPPAWTCSCRRAAAGTTPPAACWRRPAATRSCACRCGAVRCVGGGVGAGRSGHSPPLS